MTWRKVKNMSSLSIWQRMKIFSVGGSIFSNIYIIIEWYWLWVQQQFHLRGNPALNSLSFIVHFNKIIILNKDSREWTLPYFSLLLYILSFQYFFLIMGPFEDKFSSNQGLQVRHHDFVFEFYVQFFLHLLPFSFSLVTHVSQVFFLQKPKHIPAN